VRRCWPRWTWRRDVDPVLVVGVLLLVAALVIWWPDRRR
jgi:hypothetical protein